MSETIRIGVIGAGINTTLMHIPGFQAIDGVEVVSVANRSRESGQRVADQFGIPAVGDTWADVIDDPDVDAICIGTWPYMHRTLVLAALDAGKHVLTEARMAMNAAEAHEMLDASLENPDLVAQVVPADFTFEVDQTIIDLINDGYLGDIVVADLAVHGGFMDRNAPYTWRNDRDMSGYNIMLMGAISECFMRWLGPPTSVTAQTRTLVPRRVDADGRRKVTTIPDHVDILCEMASGPCRAPEIHRCRRPDAGGTGDTLRLRGQPPGRHNHEPEGGRCRLRAVRRQARRLRPSEARDSP